MHILRIVYDWPEPWSGLAPGPYFLSRSQGLIGHKVLVLTGGLNGKKFSRFKIIERPEKNVTVINLPRALTKHTGPFLSTSLFALFLYQIIRIFWRVDILHGHGHIMIYINLFKKIFPFLDRTNYVVHFHNCSKARYLNAIRRKEKFKFMQKYFEVPLHEFSDRLALNVCDLAIVVSSENKKEFSEFYPAFKDKIMVVENGVPTNIFVPAQKVNSLSKEIIGVGVISPRKGIHSLIESLKYLPSTYYLRWVGNVESIEYKNELDSLIKNLDLSNRVIFQGYVPNLEMAKYYQKASVFALPSSYEGFPKVVLEALSCGLLSLASGFNLNYKIHGLTMFSSTAPKNIARQIKDIVESRQKVDVEFIHKNYSWDAKSIEINSIYNEVKNMRKR